MKEELDYDSIAAQIHAFYQDGTPSNEYVTYEDLPEFLKADNRDAAMRIRLVLSSAGMRLVPRDGQPPPDSEQQAVLQAIEENIAILAEAEHDGWVESRLRNGWIKGDYKDVEKRQHHLLVSYPELRHQIELKQKSVAGPALDKDGKPMPLEKEIEAEKEKDRNSVRGYPTIIAKTKYKIIRESWLKESAP